MGVTYSHYLLPDDNTVRPEPHQVVALIEAWLSHGFIIRPEDGPAKRDDWNPLRSPTGAHFTTLGSRPWTPFAVPPVCDSLAALAKPSVLIRWDSDRRAVYPMQTVPLRRRPAVPVLEIVLSDDFENCHTDGYNVGGDTRQVMGTCGGCGHDLRYEPAVSQLSFEYAKIRRICPECGAAFRPQDQSAEIVDAVTGDKTLQPGGMCYRFAIVLDFDKLHPISAQNADGEWNDKATPRVTGTFMAVCRTALGMELNEFSCYG